jgi:YD repeat-containing protein
VTLGHHALENYDADGNLIEDGLWQYTYNARHRLVTMATKLTSGPRYD